MARRADGQRTARLNDLLALVKSGAEPEEALRQLRERHKFGRDFSERLLRESWAILNAAARIDPEDLRSAIFAQRHRILRMALTRKRTVFIKGKRTEVDDPDLSTALHASESIARLMGIEKPDAYILIGDRMEADYAAWIEVLRQEVTDPAVAARIARRLRGVMEGTESVDGRQIGAGIATPATAVVVESRPARSNGS